MSLIKRGKMKATLKKKKNDWLLRRASGAAQLIFTVGSSGYNIVRSVL